MAWWFGQFTLVARHSLSAFPSISPTGQCSRAITRHCSVISVSSSMAVSLMRCNELDSLLSCRYVHSICFPSTTTLGLLNSIVQLWLARNGMPRITSSLIRLATSFSSISSSFSRIRNWPRHRRAAVGYLPSFHGCCFQPAVPSASLRDSQTHACRAG